MVYYLALFLTVVKIVAANNAVEHVANLHSKFVTAGQLCIEDYPISDDDVTSFKDGKFPDSEHAACFSACVLRNMGLFDDKGILHQDDGLEKAKEIFNGENEIDTVKELIKTCAKVNDEEVTDGEKGCDRAKLLFECFIENSK